MNKKAIICVLFLCVAMLLNGCKTTELEGSCFPMVVMVGKDNRQVTYWAGLPRQREAADLKDAIQVPAVKGKTFVISKTEYESHLNKEPDYNHLKVLVLEDNLFQDASHYAAMLKHLRESEEFPRNTYICVADDIEDMIEMEEKLSEDIGTYLEEYLKNHEGEKKRMLTLGDLIDEQANEQMILYLPYLDVEENYIEWKGYLNNAGKIWQESY